MGGKGVPVQYQVQGGNLSSAKSRGYPNIWDPPSEKNLEKNFFQKNNKKNLAKNVFGGAKIFFCPPPGETPRGRPRRQTLEADPRGGGGGV